MMENELCLDKLTLEQIENKYLEAKIEEKSKIISYLENSLKKGEKKLAEKYLKIYNKEIAEINRLEKMWSYEKELQKNKNIYIGGIDEVGRGPLAGPVVAACVILPPKLFIPGLNDSKKLSISIREKLNKTIKNEAIAWSLGIIENDEIDAVNILQATIKAMQESLEKISPQPDHLLIDALKINTSIPQKSIIHGDSLSASIAAASILAKTFRDGLMKEYDNIYPQYGFSENKGYGTAKHIKALIEHGPCPIHRRSFIKGLLRGTRFELR